MQTALPFAFTFTAVRSTTKFEAVQFWGQTHGSDPMARAHEIRGWPGPRDKPEDDDLETFDFSHLLFRVSNGGAP